MCNFLKKIFNNKLCVLGCCKFECFGIKCCTIYCEKISENEMMISIDEEWNNILYLSDDDIEMNEIFNSN